MPGDGRNPHNTSKGEIMPEYACINYEKINTFFFMVAENPLYSSRGMKKSRFSSRHGITLEKTGIFTPLYQPTRCFANVNTTKAFSSSPPSPSAGLTPLEFLIPRGVLLTGPPGVGKTFAVRSAVEAVRNISGDGGTETFQVL